MFDDFETTTRAAAPETSAPMFGTRDFFAGRRKLFSRIQPLEQRRRKVKAFRDFIKGRGVAQIIELGLLHHIGRDRYKRSRKVRSRQCVLDERGLCVFIQRFPDLLVRASRAEFTLFTQSCDSRQGVASQTPVDWLTEKWARSSKICSRRTAGPVA